MKKESWEVEREETKNEKWAREREREVHSDAWMSCCLEQVNSEEDSFFSFLLLHFLPSLDECLVASPLLSNLPGNLLKLKFLSSPLGMNVNNFHCWSSSTWELTHSHVSMTDAHRRCILTRIGESGFFFFCFDSKNELAILNIKLREESHTHFGWCC